jgi:hypothetical protein
MSPVLRLGLFLVLSFPLFPSALVAQDPTRVIIEGTLVNDLTGEPVGGAEISLSEIGLHLFSDSVGHFRLTDLELGSYRLTITAEGFRVAEGDFLVDKSGTFGVRLEPLGDPEDRELGQARGIVRDQASGKAIEAAEVSLPALSRTTLTGANGRFRIRNIPPGNYLMRTEHLGYGFRTDSVSVPPGHLVTVEIELSVVPIELDPILVVAEPQLLSLDLAGFYDRREATLGTFLTRDQIVAKQPLFTTDVFNSIIGTRVMMGTGTDKAVVLRSGMRQSLRGGDTPRFCGPTVYLDGMIFQRGGVGSESAYLDRIVRPDQIAGLEVYTSSATVPLQYKGAGADCGVIVIWTR